MGKTAKSKKSYRRSAKAKGSSDEPKPKMKTNSIDTSSAGVTLTPNATSYHGFLITNVSRGQLYNNRLNDSIKAHKFIMKLEATNNSTICRYLRVLIVGLRGSQASADVTTWADIYRDPSDFSKSGPTGNPFDIMKYVNKDEYIVIMDQHYRLSGTSDGTPNNRIIKINKSLGNRLVQYLYNSNDARKGQLYCFFQVCEETGTSATATTVICDYAATLVFSDVVGNAS